MSVPIGFCFYSFVSEFSFCDVDQAKLMISLLRPGFELDKLLIIGMFLITLANFQMAFF